MKEVFKILVLILVLLPFNSCNKKVIKKSLVPKTVSEDNTLPSFLLSDGVLLHLETFGNPTDTMLLILHGGPGGDYQGLKSLQNLSNHYFVVFFDQRGTGLSQRISKEKLTPDYLIRDINEIKEYFSPNKPFFLLGHSWGGALATYYVQQNPSNVSKLLLAEPGALYKEAAKIANTTAYQFTAEGVHQMLNSVDYLSFENAEMADYKMAVFVSSDVKDYRDFASPEELNQLHFVRFGFLAGYTINEWQGNFNQSYNFDFVTGIKEYFKGKVLIMASDKSQRLGYDFQLNYHFPKFNNCSIIKIENSGHYFIELNPTLSLPIIDHFFQN
jgi:proline iminopeptidase